MDLTTRARVQLLLQPTITMGTTLNSTLDQLITSVSKIFETYCDRGFEYVARTEYFDVFDGQRVFPLKAWGAALKTNATVYNDISHETATYTQFPAATAVDKSLWALDQARGLITFDQYQPLPGPNVLKVTYTGGIATGATTAAGFISAYPDIANACEREVVRMFRTSTQPELSSYSLGGASVAIMPDLSLLNSTRMVLNAYRRVRLG